MLDSSKFLINEQPLLVLPSLATKIGVSQALLLQTLATLTHKQGTVVDGKTWLRITNQELHTILPFWNISTVRDNLDKLEDHGYLKISHFGSGQYDPTNWYFVDAEQLNDDLRTDGVAE